MATAKDVAQVYKLFKTQVPDLRQFRACEDETGRPYWISQHTYKTRAGALKYLDHVVRAHPRRKVVYRVTEVPAPLLNPAGGWYFGLEYRVRADFVAK